MARNRWLKERLPRLPFARRAVRRFMPGESTEEALDAAETFKPAGIGVLMTHLGENLNDLADAQAVSDNYHALLDEIERRGLDGELSVKLTQLGLDLDPEAPIKHMLGLADHATKLGGTIWIDMEGSAYTDRTLQSYRRLQEEKGNIGLCLQAYLRRTAADLEMLLPLKPAIRLVKGAYDEHAAIAFRHKSEVNASYRSLALRMLPLAAAGDLKMGLGTHDLMLISEVADQARRAGYPVTCFEVEMLFGIRSGEQRRLASEGYRVRDLISYGDAWYAWYLRRLAERPANIMFALRQVFG
jgi:proline dehydrogenase